MGHNSLNVSWDLLKNNQVIQTLILGGYQDIVLKGFSIVVNGKGP